MSALRGRVLGDEEAAKYWGKRGAEPGGKGIRSGVFLDDPASRSTQRRGAPGRKPWVKPPPKPPTDAEKVKELEAKRNFLVLKVAMGSALCWRERGMARLECCGGAGRGGGGGECAYVFRMSHGFKCIQTVQG